MSTGPLYGCSCPGPVAGGGGGEPFNYTQLTLTNIGIDTFVVSAQLPASFHIYSAYDLESGDGFILSGPLSGTNYALTCLNSWFTPGHNYAITAIATNNLIQGGVCFAAGAGAITPLFQVETWQNDTTNVPGAMIIAVIASNQVANLAQYANQTVVVGTGTAFSNPPPTTAVYEGLTNTSFGTATMSVSGGKLYVTNAAGSGLGGVSLALPANVQHLDVWFEPLDDSDTLPVGAFIQEQILGPANGLSQSLLGTLQVTKEGTSNYVASVDFSPLGAANCTVMAYSDGNLVGQVTNESGFLIKMNTSRFPQNFDVLSPNFDFYDFWTSVPVCSLAWPFGQNITITALSNNLTFTADHVFVFPENPATNATVNNLLLTGFQVPGITITNYSASPLLLSTSPSTNRTLTLQWVGPGVLQGSTDLKNWLIIPNASSPYTVSTAAGKAFFRVLQPSN